MAEGPAITLDLAVALQQLRDMPEIASAITEMVAPAVAPLMERDAERIEQQEVEIAQLRQRRDDLLHANNRYLQRARRAEDLYRRDPAAINEAAEAAWKRYTDDSKHFPFDSLAPHVKEIWTGIVHAILSKMVMG